MQTAKQLSVSLVNKPGRLANMLVALAKEKVNLRALVVSEIGDRGGFRFVPDDVEAAVAVLDKMNVRYELADVLLVEITSQSGGFRHVCERLAAEHLNIDYAYCSLAGGRQSAAVAVVKVNDLTKAQRVLGLNGTVKRQMPFRRQLLAR
ncbi:MAG: ACT domain-containing protein [Thermoguttaceae bacterium]